MYLYPLCTVLVHRCGVVNLTFACMSASFMLWPAVQVKPVQQNMLSVERSSNHVYDTQVNYWPSNVEHTEETAAKRFPPSTKAVESGQKVRTDLPKAQEDPLYDFRQPGMPVMLLIVKASACKP